MNNLIDCTKHHCHCHHDKNAIDTFCESEEKNHILSNDINRAIGRMRGLGYPDKYLENKYNLKQSKPLQNETVIQKRKAIICKRCGAKL